jgi:hypothetical protein
VKAKTVIALDGEGHTTKDGKHLYTYMSASTSEGLVTDIEDRRGLRTPEILDWVLGLPEKPFKVGYALGYDWTKWMEALPPAALYQLWRPDLRQGKHGPRPIRVLAKNRLYSLNLVSTRLAIAGDQDPVTRQWNRRRTVWDVFKFFGRSFVSALEQWNVGTSELRAEILAMKEKRGSFKGINAKERAYCQDETRLLAELIEKLLAACAEADLDLKDLYGPGSLAAAMLRKGKAKEQIVTLHDRPELADPVQRAFFGGRFEISRVGPVKDVHSYDIASAYPCAETQLPCLSCGKWRRVVDPSDLDVEAADVALVRWHADPHPDIRSHPPKALRELPDFARLDLKTLLALSDLSDPEISDRAWGPFPWRGPSGNILFPVVCPSGGWVFGHEWLAARSAPKLWPNLRASEALLYETSCDCGSPFKEEVADAYVKRLEWGKEGKGLTLKLAVNSRYGKRAQSSGSHPFRCLVAAGFITSYTRAMILRAIATADDPWSIVSIATDGILSTEPLTLERPPVTGAETRAREIGKSTLGEWESKEPGNVFLMRPGMRFDLDLAEKVGTTAARGLGVKVLHEARKRVLAQWKKRPLSPLKIQQPARFHGAKLSINVKARGKPAETYTKNADYGLWKRPDPYNVSYEPLPKRPCLGSRNRVMTWALSDRDPPSAPYDAEVSATFNADLSEAEDWASAQPDADQVGPVGEDL